jgi:hypothetical protein
MAQAIIATITDTARSKFADMLQMGRSFTITDFSTGEGGHDSGDPAIALTPDPTATSLPLQSFGPKSIASKTLISPFCVEYLCGLNALEAVGPLSNIGLWAKFTYSPIPGDTLVTEGKTFLFAIANFPLVVKTDAETRSISIQVNY